MAHRLLPTLALLGASLAAFGAALAQAPSDAPISPTTSPSGTPSKPATQESDSTAAPATPSAPSAKPTPTEPAASPAPTTPSADTLKKARLAGYHPETKHGTTMYCQETANIGTRFPTKKCIDESQLKLAVDIHNDETNGLRQPNACAGASCTGH